MPTAKRSSRSTPAWPRRPYCQVPIGPLEEQLQAVCRHGRVVLVDEPWLPCRDHAVRRQSTRDRARSVPEVGRLGDPLAERLEIGVAEPLQLRSAGLEVELPRDRAQGDRQ
jgi:hypothetical protein